MGDMNSERGWGGKRPGSGRPAYPEGEARNRSIPLKMSDKDIEQIDELKEPEEARGKWIYDAIQQRIQRELARKKKPRGKRGG
jgi:hypothetical protein